MFSDQHRWLFNLIVGIYSFTYLSHTAFSAALCLDPPAIINGMRTFTGNSVGDTATYTCNSGFELIGDPITTCTAASNGNSASFPAVPPPMCSRECCINITKTDCMSFQLWHVYKIKIIYECFFHMQDRISTAWKP